ncbi:aldehyde dehydrogenase [Serendipita vermifera]|nr:aldehyde dehydrogenase [Serendipita vermifera]
MSTLQYTSLKEIDNIHDALKTSFRSGKMQSVAYRKRQLANLAYMIKDNTDALCDAVQKDLHRNPTETLLSDTGISLTEAINAFQNVDKWAKDIKASTLPTYIPMKPRIKPTPKGVVLIISPFNYPYLLTFTPLVGALAAGCTVVLKLPENLPNTSPLIEKLVAKYMDPEAVRVVQGGVEESTKLLQLQWDHIFFTGSTRVGRIIAAAAAKFNTPITLELGGKCPVIIDPNGTNLALVAKRILWGRTGNAGQTCVAPDYVLVPRASQYAVVQAFKAAHKLLFSDKANVQDSNSFARLVNEGAAKRVKGYLDETKGNVAIGGKNDLDECFVEPTVLVNVTGDDAAMKEEIFGPILSIVPVDNLDDAITFISSRPDPLALYVFSHNAAFKEKVTKNTRSGAIVFNDVNLQVGTPGLPFGGVGGSGYGAYKGKYGFDTFTQFRSTMDVPNWVERFMSFRYPPFTPKKHKAALQLASPPLPFDRQGRATLKSKMFKWLHAVIMATLIILAYRQRHRLKERLIAALPALPL